MHMIDQGLEKTQVFVIQDLIKILSTISTGSQYVRSSSPRLER